MHKTCPWDDVALPLGGVEVVDVDEETGDPTLWDCHAGMKALQLDDCALDEELEMEDELPYGGANEVNSRMVNMLVDLEEHDAWDDEWLPLKE